MRKRFWVVLFAMLCCVLLPSQISQADSYFEVTNNNQVANTYSIEGNVLTVRDGADITVKTSAAYSATNPVPARIVVAEGAKAVITLDGVFLQPGDDLSALDVPLGAELTLRLNKGKENLFNGRGKAAGISVPAADGKTAALYIECAEHKQGECGVDTGCGKLTAACVVNSGGGGRYGAGIGGSKNYCGGKVVISDGEVTANAHHGVGIMRGQEDNRIDPQGMATRAELAAMLQRFLA